MSKQLAVAVMLIASVFLGCGSSKRQEAARKREASIAEMNRVQTAFGDLQIAIKAGVSKPEFSQRTNDTLVKIGDLQHSEMLAETGLPTAKDRVAEVYVHFNHAAEDYVFSKSLLEPNAAYLDTEFLVDLMDDSEWKVIQNRFPDRVESGYFTFSSRSKNALGLWGLAEEETKSAGDSIELLSAPAS